MVPKRPTGPMETPGLSGAKARRAAVNRALPSWVTVLWLTQALNYVTEHESREAA